MDRIKEKLYQRTMIASARFIEAYNNYQEDTKNNNLYSNMSIQAAYLSACVDMLTISNDYDHYKKYVKTLEGKAFIKRMHDDFGYEFDDGYFEHL